MPSMFMSPSGLPMGQGIIHRNLATTIPPGYDVMIDSAFPSNTVTLHGATVTLAYIGGDTPHAWAVAEIAAAAARTPRIWPCWVRSNPAQVNATTDANACVSALQALKVPKGTNVILDLETAVATSYVNTFNSVLGTAGYVVCKYGSSGFIWNNPKTSGGTFVAQPGAATPVIIGDAVATQFDFAGNYDLSWVEPSIAFWEAGNMALTQADANLVAQAVSNLVVNTATGATVHGVLSRTDTALPAIQAAVNKSLDPAAVATAVVADLATAGFTADQIAQHVLAGLPAALAADVVAAMGAKLSA